MKRKTSRLASEEVRVLLHRLKQELTAGRFRHILGVMKTAKSLARRHQVDARQALLAAALHDCAKLPALGDQRRMLKRSRLALDPWERRHPPLWHAPLGAWLARNQYGIRHAKVLRAIRRHTVASPGMSRLEMLIFVADAIEEQRSYAGVGRVRQLARRSLVLAFQEALRSKITFVMSRREAIHPRAWAAWNWVCQKVSRGPVTTIR